jgi:hypothetical protein
MKRRTATMGHEAVAEAERERAKQRSLTEVVCQLIAERAKTKHTPTPWTADLGGCITSSGLPIVTGRNGALLTTLAMNGHKGAANADFIVRCVNCHDELVAALQETLGAYRILREAYHADMHRETPAENDCELRARAALAKATQR